MAGRRLSPLRRWCVVLRAYSWPASLAPALVGAAAAARHGRFSAPDLALTLLAALLAHSGANLANTYFDFIKGVDGPQADDRGLVDGLMEPRPMLALAAGLFAAGGAIGLLLVVKNGIPGLLWLGAAGFALAWTYTGAGVAYKYRALGDAGIFLTFGPGITAGSALIQARALVPEALWLSIPMGLLITAILHANNMRDEAGDAAAGVSTLAGRLGRGASMRLYHAMVFVPYLFTLTLGSPWPPALCALSLPLAFRLRSLAARGLLSELVPATAALVAAFGALLSAGLLLAA